MNERIRKLALETDAWCDQNWAGHEFYNIRWEEKFAELLIEECILIARKAENEDEVYAWFAISNHFGVKE